MIEEELKEAVLAVSNILASTAEDRDDQILLLKKEWLIDLYNKQ